MSPSRPKNVFEVQLQNRSQKGGIADDDIPLFNPTGEGEENMNDEIVLGFPSSNIDMSDDPPPMSMDTDNPIIPLSL